MTKPVTIPNTFATATTAIPLSNLDADFSTVATALNDANTYSNYAPDTGSANAYVVTLSGVSTTYSAGLRIQFKAGNANTTASTLNVNGGGAKNITYQDATAIASGTIAANSIVDVMYDGTQFLLMNDPAGATGGDVVGPSSATDNAIVRFDGTTGKLVQNSVVTIADSTGDISGVGTLNATTLDATNIEVTNIKAKDGTAAASIADSTGVISITSNPVLSGGTANGVLYVNGSKVATSGSALVFDGTNLGLGVTPSAWGGTYRMQQIGIGAAVGGRTAAITQAYLSANWYQDGSGNKYIGSGAATQYQQDSGAHYWFTAPSGTAGNAISFTQAMTLTSGGDLLVGTTSTSAPSGGFVFSPGSQLASIGHVNGTSSGANYTAYYYNATLIGGITQNGTTGVLYNITSDRRLKQNIVPAPSASDVIDAIEIVSHDWKAAPDEHVTYGVIAQDLALVAPQAVLQGDDGDEIEKTWGVDYSKLVPMLVKEIQSLRQRVALLEGN